MRGLCGEHITGYGRLVWVTFQTRSGSTAKDAQVVGAQPTSWASPLGFCG